MEVSLSFADSVDFSHSLCFSHLQSPSAFPSFLSEGSQIEYSESHGCDLEDEGIDEHECECLTATSQEDLQNSPVARTLGHGSLEKDALYKQCYSGINLQEKISEAPIPDYNLVNSEGPDHGSEFAIDDGDNGENQAYNGNDNDDETQANNGTNDDDETQALNGINLDDDVTHALNGINDDDDDETQAQNGIDDDEETIDGNFQDHGINRDREDKVQSRASFDVMHNWCSEHLADRQINDNENTTDPLLYLHHNTIYNNIEGDKDSHLNRTGSRPSIDLPRENASCVDRIPLQNASLEGAGMDSSTRSPKTNISAVQGVSIRALKELLINLPKENGSPNQDFANRLPSADTSKKANTITFQKEKHVSSVNTFVSSVGSGESEDKENYVHSHANVVSNDKLQTMEVFKPRKPNGTSIHVLKESASRNIAPVCNPANVNLDNTSNGFKAMTKMVAPDYNPANVKAERVCDGFATPKKKGMFEYDPANVKSEPVCNDSEIQNNIASGFSAVKVKLEPAFSEPVAEINPVFVKSRPVSSEIIGGNGGMESNLVDVKTELFFGDTDFDVITSNKGLGKPSGGLQYNLKPGIISEAKVVTFVENVKKAAPTVRRLSNTDSRKRVAAKEAFQLQESKKKFIAVKSEVMYTVQKEPNGTVLPQPKGWMCPKQTKKNFKCRPKQVLIDNWLVKQR